MRGASQSGFSCAILRMRALSSAARGGRPEANSLAVPGGDRFRLHDDVPLLKAPFVSRIDPCGSGFRVV